MKEIFNRRSIRSFQDRPVEPEKIERLLRAAMQAPSACNQQPWEFIVIQEPATLAKLAGISPHAGPVGKAAAAFVLLADKDRLVISDAWQQDLGAAAENLMLEAVHLALGSVWLGVATSKAASDKVRAFFDLPEKLLPFALIAVGYPDGRENTFVDRYQADRVRFEKWR